MINQRNARAFTLIELLIVMVILMLFFAFGIPNMFAQRSRTQVKTAAAELKAELRNLSSWASAVKLGTPDETNDFNTRLYAYGLHMVEGATEYVIYEVWEDAAGQAATFAETPDLRKQTIQLPAKVVISAISPVQPIPDELNLLFTVPQANLDNTFASFDANNRISIDLSLGEYTTTVTVSSGAIISQSDR